MARTATTTTMTTTTKATRSNDNKILLKIQGADLRMYDKYKKRPHLITATLWYNCKECRLKQECIEVGWVSIPSHLLLYTESMELQKLYWIQSDLIESSKLIFVDKEHVRLTILR